jgi:riboflavin synthase
MFTGLIEEIGVIEEVGPVGGGGKRITFKASLCGELDWGESIAVQGVCLTVVHVQERERRATVEAVGETMGRTTLRKWRRGLRVNLERALKLGDRLGGHMVTGHVDGIATMLGMRRQAGGVYMTVRTPANCLQYVAPQGAVALDGVSLTIAGRDRDTMVISLIPETLRSTTLAERKRGDELNLEVDPFARYLENLLEQRFSPQRRGANRIG